MCRQKMVLQKRECEWNDAWEPCDPLDILIKKELGQAIVYAYEPLPSNLKECIFLIEILGKTQNVAARELLLSRNTFRALV